MENKRLSGDNYVNIQGRIMVLVHCPSSHCHLSINQVSFQSLLILSNIWPGQALIMENKRLRGDNSVNIQGRIVVPVYCLSSYCHYSINQVSLQSLFVLLKIWPGQPSSKSPSLEAFIIKHF